jgi:PAS domain-containing protein
LGDSTANGTAVIDRDLRDEIAWLRRTLGEHVDERISLQALIDRVPDYLFVKDADSRFIIANRAIAGGRLAQRASANPGNDRDEYATRGRA